MVYFRVDESESGSLDAIEPFLDVNGCLLLFLVFFILFFAATNTSAQTIRYHPDSHLRLGGGFNPASPTTAYPRCISFQDSPPPGGVPKTVFTASLVKSRRDLYESLGISTEMAGHYGMFSGNAALSFGSESKFHADGLTWIIKAESDFGNVEALNLKLLPPFNKFDKNTQLTDFINACGTHFVLLERRKGLAAAIFSVSNLSSEQQQRLSASFGGGISTGVWGAEAKVAYEKFFSEAEKLSRISVSVFLIGGDGVKTLSPLVANFDNLEVVSNTLAESVANLTFKNAAAAGHTLTSMDYFQFNVKAVDIVSRDFAIGEINLLYTDARNSIARLDAIISGKSPMQKYVTDAQVDVYKEARTTYRTHIKRLRELARTCMKDESACDQVYDYELPSIDWPKLPHVVSVVVASIKIQKPKLLVEGLLIDPNQFGYTASLVGNYKTIGEVANVTNPANPWKRTVSIQSVDITGQAIVDDMLNKALPISDSLLDANNLRFRRFITEIDLIDYDSGAATVVGTLERLTIDVNDSFGREKSMRVWSR